MFEHLTRLFFLFLFLAVSHLAAAKPDGRELFGYYCSGCHGEDGLGGIGLDINKEKLARELTDDYLRKTIRNGRPGRIMPAFETLSDAQVNAIVSFIRSWVGTEPELPVKTFSGNLEQGGKLFLENCSVCHGKDGTGGMGTGVTESRKRSHKIIPPGLNNQGFLAAATDSMLAEVIKNGRLESGMPAFMQLSEQQVADLVVFIRNWQDREQKPAPLNQEPAVVVESAYGFRETINNLKETIFANNYRIFPDRELEMGFFEEDEVNHKQVTIRACNFKLLYDLLNIEPRLGVVLPCRITVVEEADGSVKMIAANMHFIARIFNNAQLTNLFTQLHETQLEIMEEANF